MTAVSAIDAARAWTPPIDEAPTPRSSDLYVADWVAPTMRPVTITPVTTPAAANDVDLNQRARESSLLAADVYRDTPAPPPGWRVADQSDLDRMNLTPDMLEQPGSSFRARVYVAGSGDDTRYVVAFRGSQTGEDWRNNVQQALGLNSESYAKALRIGKELARSDAPVTLTGHSLGGGLASAAAVASGREADTFNAAGLHSDTIGDARAIAVANGRGASQVQAWHVPGEALTVLQNGGDRVIGGLIGGIPGALLVDAPPAYGQSHELPLVRPDDRNWFESLNPFDRHAMDWVLTGTAALR